MEHAAAPLAPPPSGSGRLWAAHPSYRGDLRRVLALLAVLAAVQGLVWLAQPWHAGRAVAGYLPLHTVLETIAIVVATMVAAVGWRAPEAQRPGNLSLLATVFFGVAFLDLLHTLSYMGMPALVSPSSSEKATHFWLAARALAALGLLAAASSPWQRQPMSGTVRGGLAAATALFLGGVAWVGLWHPDSLPQAYAAGRQPTPFWFGVGGLLVALHLVAAALFWRHMRRPLAFNAPGLFGAGVVLAMNELTVMLYAEVTEGYNLLGHVYKVVAYGWIANAVFLDAVRQPFQRLALANQALADSEARFRDLTGMGSDWFWEQDSQYRFTRVVGNQQVQLLMPADAVGKTRWELPCMGITEAGWRQHRETLNRREPFERLEYQLYCTNGQWRWASVKGMPVFAADGRFAGYRGVGTDITARKEAAAARRALNAELEQRVAQRTAELERARDQAEQASLAKSNFLSAMSHELRTPLNAILGFGQLLASAPTLAAREKAQVAQVMNAGSHLLSLINEVLDLARIEAGKMRVDHETVDLEKVVRECLALLQPAADARHVVLVPAVPAQAHRCYVNGDLMRLRQVLLNLLSNAIKYNRVGGTVTVSCQLSGAAVYLRVTDTGAGISAEQQRRLFQPFERLHGDGPSAEGTGIGLALSRGLVTMMGGEVGVDSRVGEGSTFWVRLPRVLDVAGGGTSPPDRAAAVAAAATAGKAGTVPSSGATTAAAGDAATAALAAQKVALLAPASGKVHTLLYIEDNAVNTLLMEALLAPRTDLRLLTAELPFQGLEMAQAALPDLVLLDIQLPGIDGYEVLRRLREIPGLTDTPVVAISANATAADIARGDAAGFSRYLTKPMNVPELMWTINRLLGLPG